jgi:hypothetical protein
LILLADDICAKRFLRGDGVSSELAFEIYLQTAARIGGGRKAKIGIDGPAIGADDANVRDIVRVIENVENIKRGGEHGAAFFSFWKWKSCATLTSRFSSPGPRSELRGAKAA